MCIIYGLSTEHEMEIPIEDITDQDGEIMVEIGVDGLSAVDSIGTVEFQMFSIFGLGVVIGILLIGNIGGRL